MKKPLTLLSIAIIIALSSHSQTVTNFGVLTVYREISDQMTAAENLGINYVRQTITLSRWNGKGNSDVNTWLANGYKLVMNINNDEVRTPFPTDLVTYESNLRSVLNVYQPEVVVIENEELNEPNTTSANPLYHYGSLQDYINELTVAVAVCKEKNLQVTNGGFTMPIIQSLHNYYEVNNKPDSALWLRQQMQGILQDARTVARVDSLLEAYRELELSFVNLHWYEPQKGMDRMTGVLQVVINYITQQTGKEVITNETGVKTDNSFFVTELMTAWDNANSKYVIFYDSYGVGAGGAYPLTTEVGGSLLQNGVAFKNYLLTHSAITQPGSEDTRNIRQRIENNSLAIKLYPNPATEFVQVEGLNGSGTKTITIANFSGNVMYKNIISNNSHRCNVKQLPRGTYYLTIQTDKGVITKTFIKE